MPAIGPTFGEEIRAAGLSGLPFSWGSDGKIEFGEAMDQDQRGAVLAVAAAHDPKAVLAEPPDPDSDLESALEMARKKGTLDALIDALLGRLDPDQTSAVAGRSRDV